jgi:pimeloyl-ACP methyl ester carboxylesterase
MKRFTLHWSILAALATLTGCSAFLRDTPTPIPTLARPVSPTARSDTLVVCLPGRGDTMESYERHGIISTLREAGVKVDAIIVDAHLGYYYKRSVIKRLRTDVLLPARQKGYRRIVLVGISLGGLGGLLGERDHPGSVDALVLIGPYLGERDRLFDSITAAGGPAAWAKGRDPHAGDVEEQLWTFLGTKSSALPRTFMLRGKEDRYGRGQRLFAELLPASRVTTMAGGHDWPTWTALWRNFCLTSDLFQSERANLAK